MGIFLFGLFPRRANLKNSAIESIKLVLPTFTMLHTHLMIYTCLNKYVLNMILFMFTVYCLFACLEYMIRWYSCTRVLHEHSIHFTYSLGWFSNNLWTCMSRFQSLDFGEVSVANQSDTTEVWWFSSRSSWSALKIPFQLVSIYRFYTL